MTVSTWNMMGWAGMMTSDLLWTASKVSKVNGVQGAHGLSKLKQLCFNPKVHRPLRARSDRSSDSGGGGPAAARWGIR